MNVFIRTNPWSLFLQGLLMVIFGIIVLANPEITLTVLTRLLGIFLLIAGAILLFNYYDRKGKSNGVLLFIALFDIGLGLIFALFPTLVASAFIIILGLIAIVSGLTNLWFLFKMKSPLMGMAIIRNILILLFGLFLLIKPLKGQEAIAVVIGVFVLLFGVLSIYSGYRLQVLKRKNKID